MAGQGSARVTLNEIDLSQVRDPEQLPQGVPAAVVGPAKRGPAFVPKTFATIQQFNETFGSLQEVSKESNANRFGPLALNEWMRNAQAGTFLRVLGVGDGNAKASNGRVTDAGFVVGDNTTYDSNNELQRNPYANGLTSANEVAALKTARTHFLGCFMKDQGDSTFLQDAGIQGDNAQAALTIKFDAVPADNSHITLISEAGTSKTYGFKAGGGQITDQGDGVAVAANLVVDTTANATAANVATALAGLIQGANGHNAGTNDSVIIIDNTVNGQLVLTQVEAGVDGNTLVSSRLFADAADDITITGSSTIKNSLASETIQFREGVNGTKASAEIVINTATNAEDLHENDVITLNALTSIGGSVSTNFTFKDGAGEAFNGEVFIESDVSNVQVLLGGGDSLSQQKETLANLNAAINNATSSNVYLNGMRSTLSADGLTLTVFQGYAGVEGNVLNVVSTLNSAAFETQGTVGDGGANTDAFTGGVAADKASITLAFSGQPNIGDSITLPQFSTANASEEFRFIADANGATNGDLDVASGAIQVELGDVLAITLENLKNAIHLNSTANVDDDDVTVTVEGSVVKIEAVATGLDENLEATLKLASSVVASNPQGDSFACNFGTKTTNFAGGDSSITTPVVRGILMSPQGVVPSMAIANEASYSSIPAGNANISKSVVSNDNSTLLSFGSTATTNLIGYQLGTVTTTDEQTFKIVLNGFESDVDSEVLTCSFNPESPNYFAKVMNTDPEKIEERGHYLHAHWDIDPAVARADDSGLLDNDGVAATTDMLGFCIHSVGDRAEENLVGGVSANDTPDFESFDSRFRTARSPWIMSQKSGGTSRKLFRLHSLDDGEAGNDRFRIMISNIRAGETDSDFGFFDLTLEAFDSDPISGEKLIQWNSLSLNPDDKNYIARVIGDKHMYYDFDRSQSKQRLVEEGDYEVRNRFVRVEVSVDVETADGASWARAALPCGFKEYKTLNLAPRDGLFDELGTDGSGTNRLLPAGSFDSLKVLPLPFVKHITRKSGLTTETSEALAWGVKFAKKQKAAAHQEIGEIRFNPSIVSWTKFFPDMGSSPFAVDSVEEFSLEHIAWDGSDWATSEYIRSGDSAELNGKQFVQLSEAAKSGRNVRFLKFRCMMQGGFDGLNIFNKEKAAMSSVAAFREANEEVADSNVFTGPTIAAYKRAIDVLADKSATEFQLLAIPGMREPLITDYAITACESRFDAMFVMDIQECDRLTAVILDDTKPSVNKTISNFTERRLDTSFAAAYFPDVIMRRPSNGSPLQVPPSVGMLGVMSLNDTLADPWFAPAGLRRGRLAAQNVKVQMNRDTLNDLYDADINPIYEPAGRAGEVYAFGQKTLLQNQSALDRINVRRLLINIRRQVKAVANTLLFEPNRASTLAKFNALVEPIMSNVQARQGVDRYKVQIDTTTTTENDVLNNTIRGKIYLQPTKSVEFISLDFVVTNSID